MPGEFESTLQRWLIVKLRHDDDDFAVLDGIDLNRRAAPAADAVEAA